eukprot:c1123_g1_i1 orf=2-211(-)
MKFYLKKKHSKCFMSNVYIQKQKHNSMMVCSIQHDVLFGREEVRRSLVPLNQMLVFSFLQELHGSSPTIR